MEIIKVKDKSFRTYLPYEELMKSVDSLAKRLNSDYSGRKEPVVLLCVLNGAIMFTAELMKRLDFECELASIKLTSYCGTKREGEVRAPSAFVGDIRGKDVIICEDIVDSGNSMEFLLDYLKNMGANDLKICTMLFKPEMFHKDFKVDYVAREIPNDFILGFGLDYLEVGRNLKDIYVLNE